MPSRITVAVCVPMAGVGGTGRHLSGGTEFLAISGILVFAVVFILEARLLWSFLIGTMVYIFGILLQGVLIRGAGFPLYATLQ